MDSCLGAVLSGHDSLDADAGRFILADILVRLLNGGIKVQAIMVKK